MYGWYHSIANTKCENYFFGSDFLNTNFNKRGVPNKAVERWKKRKINKRGATIIRDIRILSSMVFSILYYA